MTSLPSWADVELSATLPALVLAGETQIVEFKREFPKQVSDLANEIAGFATSNAGTIYLGVDNDCAIVGLENADQAGRAGIVQRIEGLCANAVKPPITPRIRFADVEGKCVLAIEVPKGQQPIYWVANIPYVRQMTAARPMTPEEVVEAALAWQRAQGGGEPTPESYFLGRLAGLLVDAEIAVEELRVREINPWFEALKDQHGYIADAARELAASAPHELVATIEPLERLAEECDIIATDRPTMSGPGVEFVAAIDEIEAQIKLLRARWLGPGRFSKRDADAAAERVRVTARLFAGLIARIDASPDDQDLDTLHQAARERGLEILRAASLGIGVGNDGRRFALWEIGMAIRELETRQVFMDGGQSYAELIAAFRAVHGSLEAWVAAPG